jgi:hypothetical protein
VYLKVWILSLILGLAQASHFCNTDFSDQAHIYGFVGGTITGTLIIGVPLSFAIWIFRKVSRRRLPQSQQARVQRR